MKKKRQSNINILKDGRFTVKFKGNQINSKKNETKEDFICRLEKLNIKRSDIVSENKNSTKQEDKFVDREIALELISKFVDDLEFDYPVLEYNSINRSYIFFNTPEDLKHSVLIHNVQDFCDLGDNEEIDYDIGYLEPWNSHADYVEYVENFDFPDRSLYKVSEFTEFLTKQFYNEVVYIQGVEFLEYERN